MVKNRRLSKSISDAGWFLFRRWLEYFADKYGKVAVAIPPHGTSQICSNCGKKVEKTLSTRTHICPHCSYVEDRDINAGKNILQKAIQCGLGGSRREQLNQEGLSQATPRAFDAQGNAPDPSGRLGRSQTHERLRRGFLAKEMPGNASGEIPSWLVGEILLANGNSSNEESPRL